mgnify:FL=1|tara:strand:- start:970 stop:1176 length:207 start_codon:yes stop_codon:yes gene_type:complete
MNKTMTFTEIPHLGNFPVLGRYTSGLASGPGLAILRLGSSTGPRLSKMIENIPKLKSAEVLQINVKVG